MLPEGNPLLAWPISMKNLDDIHKGLPFLLNIGSLWLGKIHLDHMLDPIVILLHIGRIYKML
jgi:hypothetical protein